MEPPLETLDGDRRGPGQGVGQEQVVAGLQGERPPGPRLDSVGHRDRRGPAGLGAEHPADVELRVGFVDQVAHVPVAGRFRQDLFYRLSVVRLHLPSLRDRSGDIPLLAKSFLERFRLKHSREVDTIDPEAYRRLLSYSWPFRAHWSLLRTIAGRIRLPQMKRGPSSIA